MSEGYKVTWFGREMVCYGELKETSNFEVVCDDEQDDSVWCDGIPVPSDLLTWDNVVFHLQQFYRSDIVEITAC